MPMKNLQKRFQSFLLFSDLQWKRNSWDLNTYLEFDMFQTTLLIHVWKNGINNQDLLCFVWLEPKQFVELSIAVSKNHV